MPLWVNRCYELINLILVAKHAMAIEVVAVFVRLLSVFGLSV